MVGIDELLEKLEALISNLNTDSYHERFDDGIKLLVDYKNQGGTQQGAYDKISLVYLKYRDTDDRKSDLVADWLDYVVGYIGNASLQIWDNFLD